MKVLYVTSEATPFVASGGLADVAGSLPPALLKAGVDISVIMPFYKGIPQKLRESANYITNFSVLLGWREQYCGLFEASYKGVKYYFIDNEYYFYRDNIYGHYDDAERFAFFSRAVIEAVLHLEDYSPDIIHCNDWQSALVPVYLDCFYRGYAPLINTKTIFTIHNIQYQGKYGVELIEGLLGIPSHFADVLIYDKCSNFMKGAIERSDKVTTVSESYAGEIMDPYYSHGLDILLRLRSYKLSGILNGIDVNNYNSRTDKDIFENFGVRSIEKKGTNKSCLREMFGLSKDGDKPIISMITRIVDAKGIDIVLYAIDDMVEMGYQFVLLGSGDKKYEEQFLAAAERHPCEVAVEIGFVPSLARKIYASSDMFLMPSKSEPCGLAQMICTRYGTLPIVRETGGLRDSIRDCGEGDGNGYTFKTFNAHDMLGTMQRAYNDYNDKNRWSTNIKNAYKSNFSWAISAEKYKDLYESLV